MAGEVDDGHAGAAGDFGFVGFGEGDEALDGLGEGLGGQGAGVEIGEADAEVEVGGDLRGVECGLKFGDGEVEAGGDGGGVGGGEAGVEEGRGIDDL